MHKLAATLQAWGPLGALLLAALDSAGLPLPASVDALLVVVAALRPESAWMTAALAVVGSALGSMFLFYAARKGGKKYLERHTRDGRAARLRIWFLRYGLQTVFIPALLPIPLPLKISVISAGALGVSPRSFILVILAARIPRYFGLAWLGAQLGDQSLPWLKEHVWHMVALAAILFVLLSLLMKRLDRGLSYNRQVV